MLTGEAWVAQSVFSLGGSGLQLDRRQSTPELIQLALKPRAQSQKPLQWKQHLALALKEKRNMLWFCR